MRKNLFAVLLLAIVNILYFAPVIFSHNTFISRDIYIFYNPKHFFAAENIKQGTLPLWNPYLSSGVPFQANVQSCVFYPLSSIYYFLPFQTGYKYFIVLHYFLGSLFMFLLMREWRYGTYAAMVSALVFAYGGYLVSILDNVCFLASAIWLPLIVLLYHQALKTGSFFYCLAASLCLAMQIFAGDASFYVLSTLLTLFLYTLLWPFVWVEPKPSVGWLRSWGMLISSIVIGLLVASIQLIPMLELVLHSMRFEGLTFETATKWSYHPLEFLQLLMPYVFGSSVPTKRWFGQFWLDTCYAGIFPLIFTGFFFCYCRERMRYFLITLFLCSLLLSLGKYNPLFSFIYLFLPGMNMLQYPVKFLFPATFCLAIMTGKGAECFLDHLERKKLMQGYLKFLGIILILFVSMLVLGGFFSEQFYVYFQTIYPKTEYFQGIEKESFFFIFKSLSLAIIIFALFFIIAGACLSRKMSIPLATYLVILVIFCDLASVGKPDDPYISETAFSRKISTTAYLQKEVPPARTLSLFYVTNQRSFLHVYQAPFAGLYKTFQEVLLPNLNMYYHIPSVDEYSELDNKSYYHVFNPVHDYFTTAQPSAAAKRYRDNILNLLNVRYLISTFPLSDTQFKLIKDGVIKIYENMTCLPRAFFVEKLLLAKNEHEVLGKMNEPSFEPSRMVYIAEQELKKLDKAFVPDADTNPRESFTPSIQFTDYQPNQATLKTQANKACFLVFSDNYYPGWKAYVNGTEKPVLRVNYTLRGLLLDKGANTVMFVFRPLSLLIGAVITSITLICVITGFMLLRLKQYEPKM